MWARLNERTRRMMTILVAALVAACFCTYVLKPQVAVFGAARRQIQHLDRELAAAGETLAARAGHREALQKTRTELYRLQGRFSADAADGLIMAEIGGKAAAAGVDVVHFQPREVTKGEHLLEFPVEIGVRGEFPNVLAFMELLRGLPNTARLIHFTIQKEKDPDSVRVWADFLLVMYSEKSPVPPGHPDTGAQTVRANPFAPAMTAPGPDDEPLDSAFTVDWPAFEHPQQGFK